MPGGIDPHVHLHHGLDETGRQRRLSRRAAGRSGAPPFSAAPPRSSILPIGATERRPATPSKPATRISSAEPMRLGLAHHAALRAAAGIHRPAHRGHRGRLSDAENIHHRHSPRPARAAWSISAISGRHSRCWRKAGGLGVIHAEDNDIVMHMYAKLIREGRVGFENMAEVHNRLSEDFRFRRIHAPCRKHSRHRALHDARLGRDRRRRHRRGAGEAAADLRRDIAPVPAATLPKTTNARTARSTTPIRRSSRRTIRSRSGTERGATRSIASPPTNCAAPLQGQDARQPHR